MEENLEPNNEVADNSSNSNSAEIKVSKSEKINPQEKEIIANINNNILKNKVDTQNDIKTTNNVTLKPKKEIPIEKKPFKEFVNIHLIPSLKEEINEKGLEIININLKNTNRPIAGDKCWVIKCEIKDTCTFWLSFEKEDITSLKSISLSKPNQKPSIIESFLID